MSLKVEIVIKDACVLFDLIDLEILDNFYQLDLIVFSTLQVIDEIMDVERLNVINSYIQNGKMIIDKYGQFETIQELFDANPGLSFTDCSVLELAIRKQAPVLSSDKSLRNESKRRNIPVKGVLWIIEELYVKGHISKNQALNKLHVYSDVNKRAPKNEINSLINKFKNQVT